MKPKKSALERKSKQEITNLALIANEMLANEKTRKQFIKLHEPLVMGMLAEFEIANVLFGILSKKGLVTSKKDFESLVKWADRNGFKADGKGLEMAAIKRKSIKVR